MSLFERIFMGKRGKKRHRKKKQQQSQAAVDVAREGVLYAEDFGFSRRPNGLWYDPVIGDHVTTDEAIRRGVGRKEIADGHHRRQALRDLAGPKLSPGEKATAKRIADRMAKASREAAERHQEE